MLCGALNLPPLTASIDFIDSNCAPSFGRNKLHLLHNIENNAPKNVSYSNLICKYRARYIKRPPLIEINDQKAIILSMAIENNCK
jgi:hypothetical protein